MKVRDVDGPAVLDWPSKQSVPVVAAPDYQRRMGSAHESTDSFFTHDRARQLGAEDVSAGASGSGSPGYGYRRKLDYGYEENR